MVTVSADRVLCVATGRNGGGASPRGGSSLDLHRGPDLLLPADGHVLPHVSQLQWDVSVPGPADHVSHLPGLSHHQYPCQ